MYFEGERKSHFPSPHMSRLSFFLSQISLLLSPKFITYTQNPCESTVDPLSFSPLELGFHGYSLWEAIFLWDSSLERLGFDQTLWFRAQVSWGRDFSTPWCLWMCVVIFMFEFDLKSMSLGFVKLNQSLFLKNSCEPLIITLSLLVVGSINF